MNDQMTGAAWIFLGCFVFALVLLVIALSAYDEQTRELKRLRRAAVRRLHHLEVQVHGSIADTQSLADEIRRVLRKGQS